MDRNEVIQTLVLDSAANDYESLDIVQAEIRQWFIEDKLEERRLDRGVAPAARKTICDAVTWGRLTIVGFASRRLEERLSVRMTFANPESKASVFER